jgi:hypothetical protein
MNTPRTPQDLLDALMSWSLPAGYSQKIEDLHQLAEQVGRLCGPETVADLPGDPYRRREKLIDAVEEHLDSAA